MNGTTRGVAGPPQSQQPLADRVWMAWETQRRTTELARRVGAPLFLCLDEDKGWRRYLLSTARTVRELRSHRGNTVFVQNPSMVLAFVACLLKRPLGYALVVDRHSNFSHLFHRRTGVKLWLSDRMSRFTLRHADLTIVTNEELLAHIERAGARGFVLPDPFPELSAYRNADTLPGPRANEPLQILFVSSWAPDEPIEATMEACRRLRDEVIVRITGRTKPTFLKMLRNAPPNFQVTGYLSDAEYFRLMAQSDAVMAVTDRDATLVCGGYEGAVLGKPLILGDSVALRSYFDSGCVYSDGTADDLATQWLRVRESIAKYRDGIQDFLVRRSAEWEQRLVDLEAVLDEIRPSRQRS